MKRSIWSILIVFLLAIVQSGICQNKKAITKDRSTGVKFGILRIEYDSLPSGDSLFVLHYTDDLYEKGRLLAYSHKSIVKGVYKSGAYLFKIPITKSFTYYTVLGKQPNINDANTSSSFYFIGDYNYLIPGDSVSIVVNYQERNNKLKTLKGRKLMDEFLLKFRGKGSEKCTTKHYLDSLLRQPTIQISEDITDNWFTDKDKKIGTYLDSLTRTTHVSDQEVYTRIYADVHFSLAESTLGYRSSYLRSLLNRSDSMARQAIGKYYNFLKHYFNSEEVQDSFSKEFLCTTVSYIPFLYKVLERLACFDSEVKKEIVRLSEIRRSNDFFELIVNLNNGEIRDRVLVYYFKNTLSFEDFNYVIKKAINLGKTEIAKKYFGSILPVAGFQAAYNFKLEDENGKQVQLKQFIGKVVMLDFWFTGCISCTEYFNSSLSKVEHEFKGDSNVVFISISADINRNTWIRSLQSGKYTSDYAVNLYTEGRGFFHDVINQYKVSGCPLPILIDKKGVIKEYGTPVLRNVNLLKEKIRSLSIPSFYDVGISK